MCHATVLDYDSTPANLIPYLQINLIDRAVYTYIILYTISYTKYYALKHVY